MSLHNRRAAFAALGCFALAFALGLITLVLAPQHAFGQATPLPGSNVMISPQAGGYLAPRPLAPYDLPASNGESSGRLTNLSATPIPSVSTAGATSVIFTPYNGNVAPFWNGSGWGSGTFVELSQALTDTTLSPAAAAASSVYDIFLWKNSGVNVISRGPAWTSTTVRGTGAGTSQLQLVSGYYCNQFAITNGPAAGYGLYLGTIATNASATLDYIFGSPASGGGAAFLMIWNQFNRISTQTAVVDNGVSYTYSATPFQQARASTGNQITFVSGQVIDGIYAQYFANVSTVAVVSAFGTIGLRLDAAGSLANYKVFTPAAVAYAGAVVTSAIITPQLGVHAILAIERSDGVNANTFDTGSVNSLQVLIRN